MDRASVIISEKYGNDKVCKATLHTKLYNDQIVQTVIITIDSSEVCDDPNAWMSLVIVSDCEDAWEAMFDLGYTMNDPRWARTFFVHPGSGQDKLAALVQLNHDGLLDDVFVVTANDIFFKVS